MKKISKTKILSFIVAISILCNIVQIFIPRMSSEQFKRVDSEFEKEFERAKDSLAGVIQSEAYTMKVSSLIRQLQIATIYGYYCDQKSEMDPMWRSVISKIRELDNEEIYKLLSDSERMVISEFLRSFQYSCTPPMTEKDIEGVYAVIDKALDRYLKS